MKWIARIRQKNSRKTRPAGIGPTSYWSAQPYCRRNADSLHLRRASRYRSIQGPARPPEPGASPKLQRLTSSARARPSLMLRMPPWSVHRVLPRLGSRRRARLPRQARRDVEKRRKVKKTPSRLTAWSRRHSSSETSEATRVYLARRRLRKQYRPDPMPQPCQTLLDQPGRLQQHHKWSGRF